MKSPSLVLLLGSLLLSTFSINAVEFEITKPFDALPTKDALPFDALDHPPLELDPDALLFPEDSSVLSPSSSSSSINVEQSEVHSEELPEYSSLVKQILSVERALVCVFLPNEAYEEMMLSVKKASKEIAYLRLPAHKYREDAKQAGLSGNTFPSAVGYRQDQPGKTYVFPEDSPFDAPHLLEWATRTISHVSRRKAPKPSNRVVGTLRLKKDETIVEVNAHNFDEIVFDETKDVVIELLVPELERNLQKAPTLDMMFRDVDSVVIAQADLSSKKVPLARWGHYSTLYISPIGCKSQACLQRYIIDKRNTRDVADFVLRHSKSLSQIQKDSIQLTKLALVPWVSPQLSLFIKKDLPLVYVFVKGPRDGCDGCRAVFDAKMNELQKAWKGLQGQVSWMYLDLKYYAYYARSLGLSNEGIVRFSPDFKSKSLLREGTLLQATEIIDWAREPLSSKKFNDVDLQPTILLNAVLDDIQHEDESSEFTSNDDAFWTFQTEDMPTDFELSDEAVHEMRLLGNLLADVPRNL